MVALVVKVLNNRHNTTVLKQTLFLRHFVLDGGQHELRIGGRVGLKEEDCEEEEEAWHSSSTVARLLRLKQATVVQPLLYEELRRLDASATRPLQVKLQEQ